MDFVNLHFCVTNFGGLFDNEGHIEWKYNFVIEMECVWLLVAQQTSHYLGENLRNYGKNIQSNFQVQSIKNGARNKRTRAYIT